MENTYLKPPLDALRVVSDCYVSNFSNLLLYDMMKNTKGPNVMRNAEVPVSDLETQLHEVMNNPLYFVQSAEGDKVRKNATQLSQQIAQKK